MRALFGIAACLLTAGAWAADTAAVLVYFRFGKDRSPGASVTIESFERNLATIAQGGYRVVPLVEVVAALRGGPALPNKAVAITVDGGYATAYRDGWPRLRAAGLPVTVFVVPELLDRGGDAYMSWSELKVMVAAGAGVGVTQQIPLRDGEALARRKRDIEQAAARIKAETGAAVTLFSFPGGEFSLATREAIERAGFAAAFGQHTGPVHPGADRFALPRFPVTQSLGDGSRLTRLLDSVPLPIEDLIPLDPRLGDNPPWLGFTVQGQTAIERLTCTSAHESQPLTVERLGDHRFEVRMSRPFPPGRNRVVCTAPGPGGRLRWLGLPFFVG
ncbi:MAG: chitin deacetylase [Alphaproteobacteria bacterium]|nr:chitin deacetylase [Alphaproteobacteria bacterium]